MPVSRVTATARASTFPTAQNNNNNNDSTTTSLFLMSNNNNNHIIQDDQQLLSNNDSDFSLYSATTNAECCCGNESCENHHVWMQIIRKLENDARLAAAIGQSLLQQHEKYTMDTDQSKIVMEQQLDGYREQIHKLEQSLDASDTAKQELDDEKNKWFWKWKRTQKTLDATAADLEVANSKWINLSGTLREKEAEVERLQTFEKMTKQANVREDSLRSKLEDAQQEIETYQRKEKVSDARYKKMKEKHDSVQLAYERLQKCMNEDIDDMEQLNSNNNTNRRPNTKLRCNALKKMSSERPPTPASFPSSQTTPKEKMDNTTNTTTISGIKERRKNSWPRVDSIKNDGGGNAAQPPPPLPLTLTPSQSTPITTTTTTTEDMEDGSISSIHHHHHYYYLDDQQQQKKHRNHPMKNNKTETRDLSELGALHSNVTRTLERLRATDILALNRQLGRAFDMLQVSRLSNTMIDQILGDTETTLVMASATTTEDMVSIVRLYQDMLKEIGHLRTTLNDLQVEYVKKIQENGSRLEKEIMLRQQQQQTQQQQSSSVLVTWVSNMFQLSSSSPPSPPRPRPTLSASPLSSRHHQHPYHKQNHYQSLPNIISSSSSTLSSSSSSLSYRAKQQQQPPAIKPSISSSTTTTSSSSTSSTVTTTTTTSSSSRHHHQHRRQASLRMSQSTGTARSIPSSRSSYQQRGDDWAMSSVMDRRPSMMLPMDTNFRGSLSTSLLVGR